jgi:hypothetical protein
MFATACKTAWVLHSASNLASSPKFYVHLHILKNPLNKQRVLYCSYLAGESTTLKWIYIYAEAVTHGLALNPPPQPCTGPIVANRDLNQACFILDM